ncbi:MAG: hypothetical protein JWO59_3059 [Chloroflexi bacterium]|jgi:hypothetical protein|nr:hypothetical protein [Chloroflexota bacterium]
MGRWRDLGIAQLVQRNIASADVGRPVMQLLHDLLPTYSPYRFGHFEPLKEVMETFDVERLARQWEESFFWASKRRVCEGSVWPQCDYNGHSAVYVTGKSEPALYTAAIEFMHRASQLLQPDFAYIHLFTEHQASVRAYDVYYPYIRGVVTHELRKYLPDLVWGTIFGPPYVKLFGREVLLSAPAYLATETAEDTIYLQLTESLTDLQTQYEAVANVREAVKDHLGRDAFLDMDLGIHHKYRTPEFVINP